MSERVRVEVNCDLGDLKKRQEERAEKREKKVDRKRARGEGG